MRRRHCSRTPQSSYIDHTPHEKKRAIGSQHKESQAKVVLVVTCPHRFDRERVGEIEIECTKNTHAAAIPNKQRYRIGHDDVDGFVFEPMVMRSADLTEGPDPHEAGIAKAKLAVVQHVAGLTEENGLSTGDLKQLVGMKAEWVVGALADLREHDLVCARKHGRSVVYWERPWPDRR
jgi:hypothetical protein